jgi:carboxyl-terminal processing protease
MYIGKSITFESSLNTFLAMLYNNKRKDIIYPIGLAIVLIAGILIGVKLKNSPDRTSLTIYPRTDKLTNVLKYVENQYVDTISMGRLVEATIPTLLKHLDPHSVYIPATELKEANEPLEGGFDGIGISFNMPNDTIVVISTIQGGPSEKVGMLAGDRIVTINDSTVAGRKIDQNDIVKKLKGPNGTLVRVGVKRAGVDDLIIFEIIRDKIPLYSVDVSYMLTEKVGFIKISKFARTTYSEFLDAVSRLQKLGMERLVIDLRGNTGGYLDAATNIANEFLPEGKLIVYTQGKARERQNVYSNSKGTCLSTPVAILIDEFAASASEILAGALQDNDRAVIVGRRSFGKGLVQEQILFSDGSALRLTIARYYTPTGRSIQKPYSNGSDDYYMDINNRFLHGEFQEQDSIQFADSLKFITPKGRVVYGGGGIMPDYFVPLDTSGVTPYFNRVANRNLIYRFAFEFTDNHRKDLSKMKDYREIVKYLEKLDIVEKFVAFARKNGVDPNVQQVKQSRELIKVQLMASIARNVIDNDGFYPIIRQIDNTLNRAIEIISNDSTAQQFSQAAFSRVNLGILIQAREKTANRKDPIANLV